MSRSAASCQTRLKSAVAFLSVGGILWVAAGAIGFPAWPGRLGRSRGGHGIAWADVPRTIHYQSKLTETDGTPVVGQHKVTLRLYDADTRGTKLWEEDHFITLTQSDNGIFSALLGARSPFSPGVTFNDPLWLTVELDDAGEFLPRQPLSSVSYAINADLIDGLDSTQLRAGGGGLSAVEAGDGLIAAASGGTVTLHVGSGTGLLAGADALSVDVGTTAGKIVQLDADGALPAVSGAKLTALPGASGAGVTDLDAGQLTSGTIPDARLSQDVSRLGASIESGEVADGTVTAADTAETFLVAGAGVTLAKGAASWEIASVGSGGDVTSVTAGDGLTGGGTNGEAVLHVGAGAGLLAGADALSVDVGTTAGKIVQLDADGALPAVSGARLTGVNASALASGTVPDERLSAKVSLLGSSISASELADDSVGPFALAANAIEPGDIGVADLPAHAAAHQPGGADGLPTASAVSIGPVNGAGTSSSVARADHAHEGIHSLAATGQAPIVGDATLAAGSNISLSQSGGTITIAATGSGAGSPGNRATGSAANPVPIATASDTELLSVAITKSQSGSALLVLASVQLSHTGNPSSKTVDVKLFRDATPLDAGYAARIGTAGDAVRELPVSVQAWDVPGAGPYTYRLRARSTGGGARATIRRLTVLELP